MPRIVPKKSIYQFFMTALDVPDTFDVVFLDSIQFREWNVEGEFPTSVVVHIDRVLVAL
jgi:hypothetical protein